jgi:hypothetical protein
MTCAPFAHGLEASIMAGVTLWAVFSFPALCRKAYRPSRLVPGVARSGRPAGIPSRRSMSRGRLCSQGSRLCSGCSIGSWLGTRFLGVSMGLWDSLDGIKRGLSPSLSASFSPFLPYLFSNPFGYPAGTGRTSIRRSMFPNKRRVRWLCASNSQ